MLSRLLRTTTLLAALLAAARAHAQDHSGARDAHALRAVPHDLIVFHNDAPSLRALAPGAAVDLVSVACDLDARTCRDVPPPAGPSSVSACYRPRRRALGPGAARVLVPALRAHFAGNAPRSVGDTVTQLARRAGAGAVFGWVRVRFRVREPVYARPSPCHDGRPCGSSERVLIGSRSVTRRARLWVFPEDRDTDVAPGSRATGLPILGMTSLAWTMFASVDGRPAWLQRGLEAGGFPDARAALAQLTPATPPEWRYATMALLVAGHWANAHLVAPELPAWIDGVRDAALALAPRLASDEDRARLRETVANFERLRRGEFYPTQASCPVAR